MITKIDPEKIAQLAPEERESLRLAVWGQAVREFDVSAEGFEYFYWCVTRRFMPYVVRPIVEQLVEAYREKKGKMVMAWRGFGKSTLLFLWCAYLVGKRPHGSTVVVRINEQAAQDVGRAFESLVQDNPGWKACFPNVVPDKEKGWSASGGYFVYDKRVERGEWIQRCFADHTSEPSLVCAGIESGLIIGKHPTNGMYFDDLHDERNTRSVRDMQNVVDILRGNVIPAWQSVGGRPTLVCVCTPWVDGDAYDVLLGTGMFDLIRIPIFERDDNGEMFAPLGVRVRPTWPEVFPLEEIEKLWKINPVQFERMFLCDKSSARGKLLKAEWLHEYPAEKINRTWPVYFGVDFATAARDVVGDRDYFAISIGFGDPSGGVILWDGVREHLTVDEGIQRIQSLAAVYPTLRIVAVEKYGAGEVFLQRLLTETALPIVGYPLKGMPTRSKGERFENGLAPLFTTGRAWIADTNTQFLKIFRDEWVSWDGKRTATGHDDTLDSTYWMLMAGLGNTSARLEAAVCGKQRRPNPWASLGMR